MSYYIATKNCKGFDFDFDTFECISIPIYKNDIFTIYQVLQNDMMLKGVDTHAYNERIIHINKKVFNKFFQKTIIKDKFIYEGINTTKKHDKKGE